VPPSPASPSTLAGLVSAGVIDASAAALAWVLLERGVPALVAGREPAVVDALLDGLVAALPSDRRPDPAEGPGTGRLVRVAGRLDFATPPGIVRGALAATTGRSGLALAVAADDLAGVLAVLRRQGLTDDEISLMGVVLVFGRSNGEEPNAVSPPRLLAAHYLRPVVRDAGGHLRRLAPAVLATWNPAASAWDDFAWGIVPDLAERIRMRAGDLEAERERRAAALAGHVHGGPVG